MPRDGSGVYHTPVGTTAVTDTTIDSAKYNAYTADVEQDLNTPRPIIAGGTGATSGPAACAALGAEIAAQVVTNYDSQVWQTGSFWSGASATSAPSANSIGGTCIILNNDPNYIILEARDVVTGQKYFREKNGGVWGAWTHDASDKVAKAGDTMTGTLTIGGASSGLVVSGSDGLYVPSSAGASVVANITAGSGGTAGTYYFGNTSSKYLQYDGTNFIMSGGTFFQYGGAFFNMAGTVVSGQGGTTGSFNFGNTGSKYLQYDGTNFYLNGGAFYVNSSASLSGTITVGNGGTTGTYYFGNTGTKYLNYDGTNFNLAGGNVFIPSTVLNVGSANASGNLYLGNSGNGKISYDGTSLYLNAGPAAANVLCTFNSVVAVGALGSTYNLDGTGNTVTAAGGSAVIATLQNFSGLVIIGSTGGVTEIFACAGGGTTRIGSAGGTSQISSAYNSGANGYSFFNASGSTWTFGVIALRVRPGA